VNRLLLPAFVAGVGIGTVYFVTLWLVVRRLDHLARPALWLAVTGILRLAVALGLFAVLAAGRWERLVAALVGFLAARVILTRWLGLPGIRPRHVEAAPSPRRGASR
jgi:F1F0 ATPase subunit 2